MKKTKETLECPIKDIVKCNKGLVDGGDGQTTCTDACDEGCCINKYRNDACVGFTGSVSKDGKSCIEYKACGNANIGTVCDGYDGDYTCFGAGGGDGNINSIMHSCNAEDV